MSKKKRKKTVSVKQDVQIVRPRDPIRAKYMFWAFVIWVIGVVFILFKWGRF